MSHYVKMLTALSKLSLVEVDFSAFCTSALYYLLRLPAIDAAAIYAPGPYETELLLHQHSGDAPPYDMPAHEYTQARYVINSMQPVIIPDFRTEDRFTVWEPLLDTDLRSAMLARYHTIQGRFGLLALHSYTVEQFTPDLNEFVQTAANMIAIALERSSMALSRPTYPLDYVSDICFIIGRDWHYIYLNRAASRVTRARKRDIVGQRVVDTDDLIGHDLLAIYEHVMIERESKHFQTRFLLPQGIKGLYDVQVHPIPEGILCVGQEIIP